MAKRSAEDDEDGGIKLADGERPRTSEGGDESLDYADEFEDEYESEDEVFEAGVDGRPDNEREAEERRGTWAIPELQCELSLLPISSNPDNEQMRWMWTCGLLYRGGTNCNQGRSYLLI